MASSTKTRAFELKSGDVLLRDDKELTVREVQVGRKWVHAILPGGRKIRVGAREDAVTVTRHEAAPSTEVVHSRTRSAASPRSANLRPPTQAVAMDILGATQEAVNSLQGRRGAMLLVIVEN